MSDLGNPDPKSAARCTKCLARLAIVVVLISIVAIRWARRQRL
jgi:hypothetical protein